MRQRIRLLFLKLLMASLMAREALSVASMLELRAAGEARLMEATLLELMMLRLRRLLQAEVRLLEAAMLMLEEATLLKMAMLMLGRLLEAEATLLEAAALPEATILMLEEALQGKAALVELLMLRARRCFSWLEMTWRSTRAAASRARMEDGRELQKLGSSDISMEREERLFSALDERLKLPRGDPYREQAEPRKPMGAERLELFEGSPEEPDLHAPAGLGQRRELLGQERW